jgi:TonB family protein
MVCLLALGRRGDATDAAARLLAQRPDYALSEVDAAPHVRAMLEATRRRVLPPMIRETYQEGRRAFGAGDYRRSRDVFLQVGQWLDQSHVVGADPTFADLRTLSESFLDLSVLRLEREITQRAAVEEPDGAPIEPHGELPWAALSAVRMEPASLDPRAETISEPPIPSPMSAVAAGTEPPPFAPLDFFTFDARDEDVVPPRPVSQEISGWWGSMGEPPAGTPLGALDIVVDDTGRVADARIHQSTNRVYDAVLLQSARQWRYEPARRDGRPVAYRRIIRIVSVR